MIGKWQLYSQTGVDGPEYGVRIRPGYTAMGFQKEDAEKIVAWQNASIQPARREIEANQRALDLQYQLTDSEAEVERLRSFRGRIARILGQSESDCDDLLFLGLDSRIILTKRQAARIKELEAQLKEIDEEGDCLTAAYLLGGKKKANENKVLIDYIKRLEAAFLEAKIGYEYFCGNPWDCSEVRHNKAEEKARAALEEIRRADN